MGIKAGLVEVQLNWIFVLIAGAVILLVFFGFAQKQKTGVQIEIANTVIQDLETIITSAGATKAVAQNIDMPNLPLEFQCSEECSCSFSISSISRDLQEKAIFAPPKIKGDSATIWSLPWEAPFRVMNLIYISNNRIPIIFVYTNTPQSRKLKDSIKAEFPEAFAARFIEKDKLSIIQNQNYEDAVIIFLNTEPLFSVHESFAEIPIRAVVIQEDEKERGTLTFYKKPPLKQFKESSSFPYHGKSIRYASIFASSPTAFSCQLNTVYNRYSYVVDVYAERTRQLPSEACEKGFQGARNILEELSIEIEKVLEGEPITVIYPFIDNLEEYNEELLLQSCPLLY